MSADTLGRDTAERLKQCYESAGGKNYKPMGDEVAWRNPATVAPVSRELVSQLPLMADTASGNVANAAAELAIEEARLNSIAESRPLNDDEIARMQALRDAVQLGVPPAGNVDAEIMQQGIERILGERDERPLPDLVHASNQCRICDGSGETCLKDDGFEPCPHCGGNNKDDGITVGRYIATIRGRNFHVGRSPIGNAIIGVKGGVRGFEVLPGEHNNDPRNSRDWASQRPDLQLAQDYRDAYEIGLAAEKLPPHATVAANQGTCPATVPDHPDLRSVADTLRTENDRLRDLLARSDLPCIYCQLPAADMATCAHGFPGCSRADDFDLNNEEWPELEPLPPDDGNDEFADAFNLPPAAPSGPTAWDAPADTDTDSRGVRYEGGKMVSKTGAVRSSDAQHERYDLIGTVGERRLAETYAEGAVKYSDDNWLKGFPISDVLNHVRRHINLYRSGDCSEDHLAHATWGLYAIMHYEECQPECVDIKTRLNADGSVKQYPRWWDAKDKGAA